jgi:phosphotransferase system HPr (HPr) family protein
MVTASGCKVQLECRGQTVDADSILSIVTLGAAQGSVIAVHATGESATQLVEQLAEFFENRFFDNDESDLEPNSESSPSTQG